MAKGGKHGRRRGTAQASLPSRVTTKIPFRKLIINSGTSTMDHLVALNPTSNLGDRITAQSNQWEHWRFSRLSATSWLAAGGVPYYNSATPGTQTTGVMHAIGFIGVESQKFNATPTIDQAAQLPCYALANGFMKARFVVPTTELRRGTVPWFETTSTGSEPVALQQPGTLYYGIYEASPSTTYYQFVLVEGEIEFRDPIDANDSVFAPVPANNDSKESSSSVASVDAAPRWADIPDDIEDTVVVPRKRVSVTAVASSPPAPAVRR